VWRKLTHNAQWPQAWYSLQSLAATIYFGLDRIMSGIEEVSTGSGLFCCQVSPGFLYVDVNRPNRDVIASFVHRSFWRVLKVIATFVTTLAQLK